MIRSWYSIPLMKNTQNEPFLWKRNDVPSGALTDSHFMSTVYWMSTQSRLQSSFGHNKSERSSVLFCVPFERLQPFCKFRFVHHFWRVRHRVEKSFCYGLSVFLNTRVSENGFLLVSGSGRNTFCCTWWETKDSNRSDKDWKVLTRSKNQYTW